MSALGAVLGMRGAPQTRPQAQITPGTAGCQADHRAAQGQGPNAPHCEHPTVSSHGNFTFLNLK